MALSPNAGLKYHGLLYRDVQSHVRMALSPNAGLKFRTIASYRLISLESEWR